VTVLSDLSDLSRVFLYILLTIISLFTVIVLVAQIGCLTGRPFVNPDGTKDDWREQRLFYGVAWADILIACPLSFLSVVLVFLDHQRGFFLLGMVSFWFIWANVMTTATSLRFEAPKITFRWLVVFPLGALIGLGALAWIFIHFDLIFGV
jgi:hypothetical protein